MTSKRFSDMPEPQAEAIDSEIDALSSDLQFKIEQTEKQYDDSVAKKFGLCGACVNFMCAATEFDIISAHCESFKVQLRTSYPIKMCTRYHNRNEMSLYDMKQIAYIIEISKREIGFERE